MSICKTCRNHDKCKFDFKDTVTSCSFIYPKEDIREQEIRAKAIDEFAEMVEIEILQMLTSEREHRIAKGVLDEIAEEMKKGR